MLRHIAITITLLISVVVSAATTDSIPVKHSKPVWLKAQFAGNLGLFSIGAGREPGSRKLGADINLGYLSKHINGVRVFTFAVKPAYSFRDFNFLGAKLTPYTGVSMNYSFGRKIYGKIPDYYSIDYYWPNAFHFNPFAGIRAGRKDNARLYFFTELGTVDYKIWYFFKNREITLPEILNLAVGVIIRIKAAD